MLMSTALGWLTVRIDRLRPHDAGPEIVPQIVNAFNGKDHTMAWDPS